MNSQEVFQRYIELCAHALTENRRIQATLSKKGLADLRILESFSVGYADGSVLDLVAKQNGISAHLERIGILVREIERLKGRLTIPIRDTSGGVVNIVGYSASPNAKQRTVALNETGVFNAPHMQHAEKIVFCDDPVSALLLIQYGITGTTFVFGDDGKYVKFSHDHGVRQVTFTFEGRARLFHELSSAGVSTRRTVIDFDLLRSGRMGRDALVAELVGEAKADTESERSDAIQEIEGGFLFRFPLLIYRVLGNFSETAMHMRVNIKAFTADDAFVDATDLYRHRNRQNLIYNLMDRFSLRDQVQLEQDLQQIVEVIDKHKEKKAKTNKRSKPALTDRQKDIGMKMLKNKNLIDEIAADYNELGYVNERKNKVLMYLVMTSRLMENPLHAVAISRSGAGKSLLSEVTAELCPPEDAETVSDLSQNALYYYGEDDLKHRFIVIGEKTGSEGSEYPLRELISRRSITKAIPMKDQGTGQIKTVTITVNGPISLVETTTSSKVNPENLNRCFVIGIDESEEQTKRIHELQRKSYTTEGFLRKRRLDEIREKHIWAQRLFEPVRVFNPYAELLTFPSSTLRSRRDNEKFLRLISVICFLHQFQRKRKTLKVSEKETVEYIECSIEDYRIAFELLSDGVLDNTLDDLPQPARKLLESIQSYVMTRAEAEDIAPEKIIFERKDIREFSSWSFAQVRNNFRILQDYEYISCIKSQNGLANRYRINAGYGDLDYMRTILNPDELARRIEEANKNTKDLNRVNIPG